VGLKVSFLEPHTNSEINDAIPSCLDYTMEKSVVDDVNDDLVSKIVYDRRQHQAMPSQTESSPMDLDKAHTLPDIEGFHTRSDKQLNQSSRDHLAASETQGSTQAQEDRRQLQNMVAPFAEQHRVGS
jgi:hypothetical protein